MVIRYNIERIPGVQDDKSVYGFKYLWDVESIEEAVINANDKRDIPRFCLSKVEIHPSSGCNLKCSHCYGKLLAGGSKELSKLHIKNLLEDIRKNMPDEEPFIIFSGLYSDPLLNGDINEIIRETGKYRFRFGLYTNGLLMKPELMDILLESSLKSNRVKPSYVAFNVTSAFLAGKLDQQLKLIKELIKKRKILRAEDKLQINAPLLPIGKLKNYKVLHSLISKINKLGVDNIRLSLPWPIHSINGVDKNNFSKKEKSKLINIFERLRREFPKKLRIRYPTIQKEFNCCFAMMMSLSINSEGDVFPCPETSSPLMKRKFCYGNIIKDKISDIWHGQKHRNLVKKINPIKEKCVCCPISNDFNELCNKFYFPR
jgi:radical SAM protein with 4Fe4S-binding SPASM domain